MKKNYLMLAVFISTILLSSCSNGYKKQICSPEFRVDLPIFDGSYAHTIQFPETFEIVKLPLYLERIDKGVYVDEEGEKSYVCQINNKLLIESKDQNKDIYTSSLIEMFGDNVLFSPLGFNTKELDKDDIPYEIIEKPESLKKSRYEAFFETVENNDSFLLVDNSVLENPQAIVKYLRKNSPISIKAEKVQAK